MQNYTVFTDITLNLGNRIKSDKYIACVPTVQKAIDMTTKCHPRAVVMKIVDNLTNQIVYTKPAGAPSHNSWHC